MDPRAMLRKKRASCQQKIDNMLANIKHHMLPNGNDDPLDNLIDIGGVQENNKDEVLPT